MAINRAQIRKQLVPGLNTVFGLEYKQYPEEWKDIFTTSREGNRAYIEDVLMTGFAAAPTKAEGAGVSYDTASEGYVARYVFETIALAFALTEEAMEDNLYGDLGSKMSKALARSMQYTKNVKGANILNNGFSTTLGAIGDGAALFSLSHPTKSGVNGANILTTGTDLSETSLEDMMILLGATKDDRGIPMTMRVKKLIVPINLQFVAQRITKTEKQTDTAENNINALKSMGLLSGGFAVNHYLTDTDAWFLTTDCPDGLRHVERVALKTGTEGDFESGNLRYKARERYIFGASDWRGGFASPGG